MSLGNPLGDDHEVMSEINMTPLVDVMLVLLIIFIITVPVITHAVKLDLPRATSTPNEVKPDNVTLSITADGIIHWNSDVVDDAALQTRLAEAAAQPTQPDIHVLGDRAVDYQHVIRVIAAAQRAGILKLGFVTEPNE